MPVKKSRVSPRTPAIPWGKCIAKSIEVDVAGLTVYEHCRNVGEVARTLIERLPAPVVPLLGESPVATAACHDVGKISPGYQRKYFNEYLRELGSELADSKKSDFEEKHAKVSEVAVNAYLGAKHDSSPLAVVVGSHHGVRIEDRKLTDEVPQVGGTSWASERQALLQRLVDEYGPLVDEPAPDLDVLSGLICVADWIGSDEEHFPPAGLPEGIDLSTHAHAAVEACGWGPIVIRPGLSFKDIFSNEPYPIQRDFVRAVDSPGLYVLEAPMGLGKTEAALYTAYRLMEEGHNSGFYFGLPTRLTSDRIHRRVLDFVKHVFLGDDWEVRLAHGQAWMKAFEHGGKDLGAGKPWFRPSKRALLLPFAVGTIDQALLSVLKVRHHFVRAFGLAGKVVILDEVHSYDVYTGTLLDLLVKRLLAIGCTVIILSATLTSARRYCFFEEPALLGEDDSYPLISMQSEAGTRAISSPPPKNRSISVSVESLTDGEVASLAVEKALSKHCVLCIVNTVAQAQRWYNEVKAAMPEEAFDVGILHSGFPAWRRSSIEDEWMDRLGKEGDRSQGCVLVSTQVVEQSVDIDADLMITELAPTDMLLQRLGRLWRHDRPDRPCHSPVVIIVTGEVKNIDSIEELEDRLGKPNCRVYQPYVLWRSHTVWSSVSEVRLPDEIRTLLESTYAVPSEDEPSFLIEALTRLKRRRKKLERLALAAQANTKGYCTMPDDERAATRYSELPTTDALLVQGVDATGSTASLVLSDGQTVKVDAFTKNPWVSAQLHRNLVRVPAYLLDGVVTPMYFAKHFYDATALLVLDEGGELRLEGTTTSLRYDDERGVQKEAVPTTAPMKKLALMAETDDRDNWEGGLDEFGW